MANPLKIKSTGGGTFLGLQEMTPTQQDYAVHQILTEFCVNTTESGTLNVDVGGTNKGSHDDTIRLADLSLQTNTYILYQNTTPVNETSLTQPMFVSATSLAEENNTKLNAFLDGRVMSNLVSNGLGSYWMSAVNPNSSLYTDTGYYVKDTRSGVSAITYTLWRKTTGVSAPSVFRPAKLSGSSISEMSDAEIKTICARFRNRIGTTGIGQYKLSATNPATAGQTWVQVSDDIVDTRTTLGPANYIASYVAQYDSQFVKSYVGFRPINYTKEYEGVTNVNYVKAYSGTYLGNYTKEYMGQYEGSFVGNYTKQYEGSFATNYTKEYIGQYSRQFSKQYVAPYLGGYTKTYTGQYSRLFEGGFNKQYEGV